MRLSSHVILRPARRPLHGARSIAPARRCPVHACEPAALHTRRAAQLANDRSHSEPPATREYTEGEVSAVQDSRVPAVTRYDPRRGRAAESPGQHSARWTTSAGACRRHIRVRLSAMPSSGGPLTVATRPYRSPLNTFSG